MKKNNRIKRPIVPAAEVDIDAVTLALAIATNEQRKLTAAMDAELQAIRERYENGSKDLPGGPLTDKGLAFFRERVEDLTDQAQRWAEANPDKFAKRKSIELTHAKLGFRTGTPKLKTLRGFTWNDVLAWLRGFWKSFIRKGEEQVNKEAILAAYASKKIDDVHLTEMGLRVVQEETFYIDPDLSSLPARQTAPAETKAA